MGPALLGLESSGALRRFADRRNDTRQVLGGLQACCIGSQSHVVRLAPKQAAKDRAHHRLRVLIEQSSPVLLGTRDCRYQADEPEALLQLGDMGPEGRLVRLPVQQGGEGGSHQFLRPLAHQHFPVLLGVCDRPQQLGQALMLPQLRPVRPQRTLIGFSAEQRLVGHSHQFLRPGCKLLLPELVR